MRNARIRPSWVLSIALAGCGDVGTPQVQQAPLEARAHALTSVLTVTDLAPGKEYGLRVVGRPNTEYVVAMGSSSLPWLCPAGTPDAPFDTDCWRISRAAGVTAPRILDTVTTGPDGVSDSGGGTWFTGAQVPVGTVVHFQAIADLDGAIEADDDPTNVVARTVLAKSEYTQPPLTNILIILADDFGIDRLDVYGAAFPAHTPVIDQLAADGLVFDQAWALPLCGPTRAALQTGRLPRRIGWGENASVEDAVELDPDLITIAELVDFSPWATYDSTYIGKWQLTTSLTPSGLLGSNDQGWDWFAGTIIGLDKWFGAAPEVNPLGYDNFGMVVDNGTYTEIAEYATTRQTQDAINRINGAVGVTAMAEPWLLQVAYNAPHDPVHLPPADLYDTNNWDPPTLDVNDVAGDDLQAPRGATPDLDLYRAAVEAMDTEIGNLLAAIPQDVLDNTLIVLTSDNGTPGWAAESGALPEAGGGNPNRMKGSRYEGGVHVPLIVTGPLVGSTMVGTRSDQLAHIVDLFPTIAQIVGIDAEDNVATTTPEDLVFPGFPSANDPDEALVVDGHSLVPVFESGDPSGREVLYSERFEPGGQPVNGEYPVDGRAISDGVLKLHVDACDPAGDHLYQYVGGVVDESIDLIADVNFDEAEAVLRTLMDDLLAGIVYDENTWPLPVHTGCP